MSEYRKTAMKGLERLVDMLENAQIAFFVLMAGLAFGLAYGWPVGLGVVAATAGVLYGLHRAIGALHRKSLETKVPQRRFPGPKR